MSGLSLVITGTLPTLSREQAQALSDLNGGKVTGSVSTNTDYLVVGERPGSKLAKAENLGIPILDEQGLLRLLEDTSR